MGIGDVDIIGAPAALSSSAREVPYSDDNKYTKGFRIDVGFPLLGPVSVGPGVTVDVDVHTVTPFKPQLMCIPSDIAYEFSLVRMDLQDRSFVDGGAVPCSKFSEVAQNAIPLDVGTMNTTDILRMQFRNNSAGALMFSGSFSGVKLSK
jgi:hypothetical protein